jgi:hypothetical protein
MRKIIFSGSLLASIVSCQSDGGTEVLNQAVSFTQIGKNNLYGNGGENIPSGKVVINDVVTWENLLEQVDTVNPVSSEFIETDIDFAAFTVIAIFDEIRLSAGYDVEIVSVSKTDGAITVDVENHDGGSGAAATVITQPFNIVKIPHTTLPVAFEY